MCELQKIPLSNGLQAVTGADGPYTYHDLYGPNRTIFRSGNVDYVTRSIATDTTQPDYQNCTHEIPVPGRNQA